MQRQLFAHGKRFNREAISPVKLAYLFCPRFSVSILLSLVRRSVLSTIKREPVDPLLSPFLSQRISYAKAKHFQVSARFESHSFKDNLSRSCEFNENYYAYEYNRAFLSHCFENYLVFMCIGFSLRLFILGLTKNYSSSSIL